MNEVVSQPWAYLAIIVAIALFRGCRLKLWGVGFGVEVNEPGDDPPKRKRRSK